MLKEIIDKQYLEQQRNREQTHFYITDAGRCPRSVFFKFKKAPREEIEPRILRLFDHGDYIHQLIMKSLFASPDIHVVAAEINIPAQQIISGRADAIISDGKENYVLDIKSISDSGFKYLDKPKVQNVNQMQLYLHFFEIERGILLYVNKSTQALKEFFVDYSQQEGEKLLNGFQTLKEQLDSNIVPPRMVDWPQNWECQYCQFKEICSLAGNGQIDWEEFKLKMNAHAEPPNHADNLRSVSRDFSGSSSRIEKSNHQQPGFTESDKEVKPDTGEQQKFL